ncbi:MAG: arylesterase [Burkholderiales bacterium]
MLILFFLAGAAAASGGKTILVYGDSLSAAYGIARDRGWVALLEKRLAAEGYDYSVANASISGEITSGGLGRIGKVLRQTRPAVVILELGANDGLRGLPLAQMKQNLGAMIVRAKKSGARVLLIGMRLPPNYGPDYTEAFAAAYAELARRERVARVPFMLEGFAAQPDLFQLDGLHPNAAGQPLLLDNIWPRLQPLLEK